jgi:hypothetical protein
MLRLGEEIQRRERIEQELRDLKQKLLEPGSAGTVGQSPSREVA